MSTIFKNEYINIQIEQSVIPWLKIFSNSQYKEFSECDKDTKEQILLALDIIEKEMLVYFEPEKINIASFGNYLPQVHFHIMARFKDDPYFPEPMWGEKQRESLPKIKSVDKFFKDIEKVLEDKLK